MSESKPTDEEIYELFQTFCTPITSSEMGHVVAVAVNAVQGVCRLTGLTHVEVKAAMDRHASARP